MQNSLNGLIQRYQLRPRKIFLVDAIGAFTTASLLVFLLSNFERFFGMPKQTVYLLSVPAFLLMVLSLTSYYLNLKSWKTILKIVVLGNLSYCVMTALLMFMNHQTLTAFGFAYFIGEIGIICFLVGVEWMILKSRQ